MARIRTHTNDPEIDFQYNAGTRQRTCCPERQARGTACAIYQC